MPTDEGAKRSIGLTLQGARSAKQLPDLLSIGEWRPTEKAIGLRNAAVISGAREALAQQLTPGEAHGMTDAVVFTAA